MTVDLTKIREPFGLLDKETQKALIEHGGPYEVYTETSEWAPRDRTAFVWWNAAVYRVKPEPPKPREIWVNEYPGGLLGAKWHDSQEIADDCAKSALNKDRIRAVRFIEVI